MIKLLVKELEMMMLKLKELLKNSEKKRQRIRIYLFLMKVNSKMASQMSTERIPLLMESLRRRIQRWPVEWPRKGDLS